MPSTPPGPAARRASKPSPSPPATSTPRPAQSFFQHIDAANVDLKGFSEDFYRTLTDGRLEPVLETLRWLARQSTTWLEITNLIIPRANDSLEEIERMCRWIVEELGADVPLHFSAFHPDFKLSDRGPTPPETLSAAYDVARRCGLHYVYTGNVSDRRRQTTYCPGCGRPVIERDGYVVGEYRLRQGRCADVQRGGCRPVGRSAGRLGRPPPAGAHRPDRPRTAPADRAPAAAPS